MNKNTVTALVLMLLVVAGFTWFSQPSKEQLRQQQIQDSITAVKKKQQAAQATRQAKVDTATVADSSAVFTAPRVEKDIVLKNKVVRLTLSTKGGTLTKGELLDYKDQKGQYLTLFNPKDAQLSFLIDGKTENINTAEEYFQPVNVSDSSVTMRLPAKTGGYIDFVYTLKGDTYMVDFTVKANGMEGFFSSTTDAMNIKWNDHIRQQEKGFKFENYRSSLTYKEKDGGSDFLAPESDKEENVEKPLDWIAFKNQFFSWVFIAGDDFHKAYIHSIPEETENGYLKQYEATAQTFFDPSGHKPTAMQFFIGPNNYRLLQQMNHYSVGGKDLQLEELVYLGWPLFKYINRFFTIYVFDWLTGAGLNMGIVLLLITVLLKVITYPAMRKSFLASVKMKVLRPKMDEINKKYPNPDDNMKKQQEMMGLYSQYGVSPMGGCLPMLIQMPVWIAMFNFIPNAIELRGQSFLWADDLSSYDDLISWSAHLPLIGNHLSLFCLLFCATNVINTIISMKQQENMPGQQGQQMKMMKYMMYAMPVVFFFVFNDYSSGLSYYYFVSGLLSIILMWIMRKSVDEGKILAKLEENYKYRKEHPQERSGFMARMAALQEQQKEMMEKQRNNRK